MPTIVDTGRTFEIYSIGDGEYMRRIIDSIASMSNAGVLLNLMGLSLMIGLLLMAFRNVQYGGNKLDLGSTLVSLLLGTIMFGMKADVVIHDMNFAPGEIDQPSYTVSNVPFGIAASGYIISGISYELTLKMEQGFGVYAGGRSSIIEGGFGNTLEWINSLRMWEMPTFGDEDGTIGRFRNNLALYMDSCTRTALEMGHLKMDAIMQSKNLWTFGNSSGAGGFGYTSLYHTSDYEEVGGAITTDTCHATFLKLVNDRVGIVDAFADGIAVLKLDQSTKGDSVRTALENAYASVGVNAAQTQDLILAEVTGQSLKNSIAGTASGSRLSAQAKLMIEQAAIQRSVQWAAEETMFRRIMRPMMAFFESLSYALAPFMALAVGLGSFGIQTIGKYLMLSIWVSLWLPVLSIIELYQVTMMQHAVKAMVVGLDGTRTGGISIATAEQLRGEAIEWLSAGAAMAAFTPAITMALVWGGAVTASALANKMQGGDTVNEKITAPDAVAPAAAVNVAPGAQYSKTTGTTMGTSLGAMPSINTSTVSSFDQTSSASKLQSSTTQYSSTVMQALRETYGSQVGASVTTSQNHAGGDTSAAQNSWGIDRNADARKGVDAAKDARVTRSNSSTDAHQVRGGAGLDVFGTGLAVSKTGTSQEAQEVIDAIRATRSGGGSTSMSSGSRTGELFTSGQRLEEAVQRLAKVDKNFAQALDRNQNHQRAQTSLDQAQNSFQQSGKFEQRYGSSQDVSVAQASQDYLGGTSGRARADRANAALNAASNAGVLDQARQYANTVFSGIADKDQRVAAGAMYALYQRAQQPDNSAEAATARDAVSGMLSGTVDMSSYGQGAISPGSNAGMKVNTPDHGALRAEVNREARGPNVSAGQLVADVNGSLIDGSPQQAAMLRTAQGVVGADPGGYGPATMDADSAHDYTRGRGAAANAVTEAQAKTWAADGAEGMGDTARNNVSDLASINGFGTIGMYAYEGRSTWGGANPGAVDGRVAAMEQTHPHLSDDQRYALAVADELASNAKSNMTYDQYQRAWNHVRNEENLKALAPYLQDHGGSTRAFEDGLRHEAEQARERSGLND